MSVSETSTTEALAPVRQFPVTVLLVDDQAIVGEAVRRMLAAEKDIVFHFCQDPTKAVVKANEVKPTVILQDLVMPEIDGLTLLKFFRANEATRDTPMIVLSTKEEPTVKAQAFGLGANDYLVKLPDKIELIARIRYHSRGYINLLERNDAYKKLEASQQMLAEEVAQAAKYVLSLLPPPMKKEVQIDWRFVPSIQLGGDMFGYHWLDPDHLSIYLLDVSGHGVGASLLSVSVMNVLTAQSLSGVDFHDPSQVLKGLNAIFEMDKHDQKFFTIWYGVFDKKTRKILYAGAGHPPAVLMTGPSASSTEVLKLESDGPMIGAWEYPFENRSCDIGAYARLYVYSDGVYEINQPDGKMWQFEDFVEYMAAFPPDEPNPIDKLLNHVRQMHGQEILNDDFSMLDATL